ncbi:hypothetical protein ACLOJK_000312 [Asimina triloba]
MMGRRPARPDLPQLASPFVTKSASWETVAEEDEFSGQPWLPLVLPSAQLLSRPDLVTRAASCRRCPGRRRHSPCRYATGSAPPSPAPLSPWPIYAA